MADLHLTHAGQHSLVLQRVYTAQGAAAQGVAEVLRARMTHAASAEQMLRLCDDSADATADRDDADAVSILGVPVSASRLLGVLEAAGMVLRWSEADGDSELQLALVDLSGVQCLLVDDGHARVCLARLGMASGDLPSLAVRERPRGALRLVRSEPMPVP